VYLTRHHTDRGPRWAVDGRFLPDTFDVRLLLSLRLESVREFLNSSVTNEKAIGVLLPPLEDTHEVWGNGVVSARPGQSRRADAASEADERRYAAQRPLLFFKSIGWRVRGHQQPIRVRDDSAWNVPGAALTLVVNRYAEIIGYTAGNDVAARTLENENPLYLAQARIYNGACALGPGIELRDVDEARDLTITLDVRRAARSVLHGEARVSQINRALEDLVDYLVRELDFPHGVFLLTNTPIVLPADFTLSIGDRVTISVGALMLENEVTA
jgi:2-dehydro-3-deoxy-D-arabinonate dehydratase